MASWREDVESEIILVVERRWEEAFACANRGCLAALHKSVEGSGINVGASLSAERHVPRLSVLVSLCCASFPNLERGSFGLRIDDKGSAIEIQRALYDTQCQANTHFRRR